MHEPFLDSTTLDGQQRIRAYVLAWLERLDYRGRLERSWSAEELGARVWAQIAREFGAHWEGGVVTNSPLAEVIATTMVEDYFAAYPRRRGSRYTVDGPLPDDAFRRCVLDFVHDLEEFEPHALPGHPEAAAQAFWREVRDSQERWGCRSDLGPFVDDEERAREVALDAIRDYYDMLQRVAELRQQ